MKTIFIVFVAVVMTACSSTTPTLKCAQRGEIARYDKGGNNVQCVSKPIRGA